MTRITHLSVIVCPACLRRYTVRGFGSVNLSGWTEWSDGRAYGRLYRPSPIVKRCACGAFFLERHAQVIDHIDIIPWHAKYVAPPKDPSILRRSWRWLTRQPPYYPDTPEYPHPAPVLSDLEVADALASLPRDTPRDVELEMRRQLWRAFNDLHRVETLPKGHPATVQGWEARHRENLARLHLLLIGQPNPRWLEVGEVLRQAGRFDDAVRAYGKASRKLAAIAGRLSSMAAAAQLNVVRLPVELHR